MKKHNYTATKKWSRNKGKGTSDYKAYERDYTILIENKSEILGSSEIIT